MDKVQLKEQLNSIISEFEICPFWNGLTPMREMSERNWLSSF